VTVRIVRFEGAGVVLKPRRKNLFAIAYGEILSAERLTSPRRGLRLHTTTSEPLRVACGHDRPVIEDELRRRGVRIVDCWGAIITPSLADVERELSKRPVRLRQSYDDA
jgi:hypothetical protein